MEHEKDLQPDGTEKENVLDETIEQEKGEEDINVEEQSQTEEKSQSNETEIKEKPEEIIARLTEQIHSLERELQEKDNRLLRLQADFDNYRRRTRNEIESIEKYRSQALALEILPSVDNFERALKTEAKSDEVKSILQGMEMVYNNLLEALKKEGITPIETVGKEFDPKFHHAVMQGHDEEKEPNTVLEEYQKGYMLKDRVIRPAMVKVNQ